MGIRIQLGNVLEAHADALLLTIDGARRGLEGNIARAFARRWPDVFEEVLEQIRYPLPLGRTAVTRPESECPFQIILFASTLHHLDVLSDVEKARVTASALREAITLAARHGQRVLATAVMTGGWRLPFNAALETMLSAASVLTRADSTTDLLICVRSESEHASALAIASRKDQW